MHIPIRSNGGLDGRILRAGAVLALPATFVAGVVVAPLWIFAASALSLYLFTTALFDKGPTAEHGDETGPAVTQRRLAGTWQLLRGAAGTAAMGSVVADPLLDAYMLDAMEIFVLNLGGAYLAITAMVRDPIRALTQDDRPAPDAMRPEPVGTLPGTGPVAETAGPARPRRAA